MSIDLRIQKSEQAIEQAFLELIEEKGFENVRMIDIAKKANVNRNTIYIRYGVKEDIITSIVTKSFSRQFQDVDLSKLARPIISRRLVEMLFYSIFEALSNDIELYRIILTDPNLSGYLEKKLREIRKVMTQHIVDNKKNNLVVEYILQGVYGVIKSWIIYDTGSIEDNVKLLSNLVMSNARNLTLKKWGNTYETTRIKSN